MAKRIRSKRVKRERTTGKRIATVRRLRKEGLYIKEIVDKTGWNINTVKRYIHLSKEPRGKRKPKPLFAPNQRSFTSWKLLCEAIEEQCGIHMDKIQIRSISKENMAEEIRKLEYMTTNEFRIIEIADETIGRSNDKGCRSLKAAFMQNLMWEQIDECIWKIKWKEIVDSTQNKNSLQIASSIQSKMLQQVQDFGVEVYDSYTLKSSLKNGKGEREQMLKYYLILYRKK